MQEYTYNQKLLGTDLIISLVTANKTLADHLAGEAFSLIREYEQRFSRFNPESELSKLNEKKHLVVSPEFLAVLERSHELYQQTNGAFNPLLQIARLGYEQSFTTLSNTIQPVNLNAYNTDFTKVHIDKKQHSVTLGPDQKLDFGGLLKGYLAEKVSKHITTNYPEIMGTIINLGGDLYSQGLDADNETFIFSIDNPVTGEEIPLALKDTALATSGTYKRHWLTSVGIKNHILGSDGLTNPDSSYVSASVISEDGSLAEALTKLLISKGPSGLTGKDFGSDFDYLLIDKDGVLTTNLI